MRLSPRTPLVSTIAIAALAFATSLLSPSAHANLVFNGGFEEGPSVLPGGGGGTGVIAGGGTTDQLEGNLTATATGLGGIGIPDGQGWVKGRSVTDPDFGTLQSSAIATNSAAYFDKTGTGLFSGPKSGLLAAVLPAATGPTNYDGYISQQLLGVVDGQRYNISFWLSKQMDSDSPGETNSSITVNWGGSFTDPLNAITGGTDLLGPMALIVPTKWTQYNFYDILADGSLPGDLGRLSFTGGADFGAILIDDVVVEIVPEISSFGVLIGFGLLALGSVARIRRRTLAVA